MNQLYIRYGYGLEHVFAGLHLIETACGRL